MVYLHFHQGLELILRYHDSNMSVSEILYFYDVFIKYLYINYLYLLIFIASNVFAPYLLKVIYRTREVIVQNDVSLSLGKSKEIEEQVPPLSKAGRRI